MKNTHLLCKKRLFFLCEVLNSERWLADMAASGWLLQSIDATNCFFNEITPIKCRFFLLDPEPGNNSEAWLFFDIEKLGGKKIPCRGPFFFSPRLALFIQASNDPKENELVDYYYKYRNWRLARRFLGNTVALLICTLISASVVIWETERFFPFLIVCTLLLSMLVISLSRFLRTCGGMHALIKPGRPGY